jgi:hypothetical protein
MQHIPITTPNQVVSLLQKPTGYLATTAAVLQQGGADGSSTDQEGRNSSAQHSSWIIIPDGQFKTG